MKAEYCPKCGSTNIIYNPHPLLSCQNICLTCGIMFEVVQKKVEKGTFAHKVIQKFKDASPLKVVTP